MKKIVSIVVFVLIIIMMPIKADARFDIEKYRMVYGGIDLHKIDQYERNAKKYEKQIRKCKKRIRKAHTKKRCRKIEKQYKKAVKRYKKALIIYEKASRILEQKRQGKRIRLCGGDEIYDNGAIKLVR
ncbi:hypothetical protein [Anaerosacchariphilus polymeriproducens]|uniref:Uncharacterized protein n=1 Tax=Anaerosacchariphilus polymeriproducens TaxID=1812858 RepID=A0A371AZ52_9FIRM|nr:hypothetical protein [Anaerosacchariphilus polymeriproducens]RDU24760.1 hypothetical protein DWV06_02595 [Anaerosacchariphilus polymeriproducens]